MGTIRTFRDLVAWQKGMALAALVYGVTREMPAGERFGLMLQARRAAVSILSNIAEGYGRQSTGDYLRFLRVARGSLAELSTQLELAATIGMMAGSDRLSDLIAETDRVLQGLIRSLEKS